MKGVNSLERESGTAALRDRSPLSACTFQALSPRSSRFAPPRRSSLLALLALLPLGAIGCSHGPQPVVAKKSSASAPAQPVAPAPAVPVSPAPAVPGSPASTASGSPAAAPAAAGAMGLPPTAGATAPATSPALSSSENARTVEAAKEAAGGANGGGKPASPNAGIGGAPPTGAQGKTTLPGKLEHPDYVVVIDDGDAATDKPKTLVEAAKAEKARRAQAGRSTVVINDKNLHKYAKGTLTFAAPKKPSAPSPAAVSPEHDEQYWRHGVLEIRLRLKKATEQVKELGQSASDWRRRFYAQDDPYVRDGQIKPAWDRVLDELREAQTEIDVSRRELEDFLDKGRREGALPGWLREGIEQEPPAPPKPPTTKNLEAIEPPILKEPPILNDPLLPS